MIKDYSHPIFPPYYNNARYLLLLNFRVYYLPMYLYTHTACYLLVLNFRVLDITKYKYTCTMYGGLSQLYASTWYFFDFICSENRALLQFQRSRIQAC